MYIILYYTTINVHENTKTAGVFPVDMSYANLQQTGFKTKYNYYSIPLRKTCLICSFSDFERKKVAIVFSRND